MADEAGEPVEGGDAAPDSASETSSASGGRRRVLIAALGFLVVLVGLNIWAGWQALSERRDEHRREQMVQAGRDGLLALTTIDHQRVDQDVQRILDSSTGDFRDEFAGRAESFKEAARKAQSQSVGTVSEAALESDDGDSGRVLVALTVMTSNRGVPERSPKAWRTRVTVTEADGEFRVSTVEFIQ